MRIRRDIFLLFLAVVALSCRSPETHLTDGTVALVADDSITLEDYHREYASYLLKTGLTDGVKRRYGFLDRMVGVRLITQEAEDNGLKNTDEFRSEKRRVKTKLLIDLLIQREVLDSIRVYDTDLKDMLVRINTELTVRHLYARTRREADRLFERLSAGESFDALATEVFRDPALASSGGALGTMTFDEMDPAFENAAYRLKPGEFSHPVQTSQGFSIVRVDSRYTKPLLTETDLATRKDRLGILVRDRKVRVARRRYLNDLMASTGFSWFEGTLTTLFATIRGNKLTNEAGGEAELLDRDLISFYDGESRVTWKVRNFREQAALASSEHRAAVETMEDLRAFVQGLVIRSLLEEKARAAGLADDPNLKNALKHEMADWMYAQAYERIVNSIEVDDDSLTHYYELFKDEFSSPERVRIHEILVGSRIEADRALEALKDRAFEEVAARFSIRPGAALAGGDLGLLSRDDLGVLGAQVFSASPGTVSGPLEVDGQFVIIRVGERVPSRTAPIAEVRDDVRTLVRQLKKQTVLRSVVERLKNRYDVRLNPGDIETMQLTAHVSS